VGAREATQFDDPDVRDGARFHVVVDALFHQTPTFIHLNRIALRRLRELGVSRGPARACAHIGVEMLIDAQLVKDQQLLCGYIEGLDAARVDHPIFAPIDEATSRQLERLCAHLSNQGAGVHTTTSERFRARLRHTLQGRPRLAPTPRELEIISNYLCTFDTVADALPALMAQLEPLFERAPRPGSSNSRTLGAS
jgi:hypothetical protein